jgi:hypothetical protein
MNLQRQLKLWLFLVVVPSSLSFQSPAFQGAAPSKPLDMTATLDTLPRNEIDISDVLAQAEAALQAAQESLPSSKSIGNEIMKLTNIQNEMEESEKLDSKPVAQDQLTNTAIAGALGVVTGNPIMLGAALGYAGSQMMEGENAEKTLEAIENLRKGITKSIHETISLAHNTLENEGDLSKLPQKIVQGMLLAQATKDFSELKTKPKEFLSSWKSELEQRMKQGRSEMENLKDAPTLAMENVKHALESDDLKEAPGRAFNAFSAFLNSDEVKQVQKRALKAMKDSLESEEMKALQSRASKALNESRTSKALNESLETKQ